MFARDTPPPQRILVLAEMHTAAVCTRASAPPTTARRTAWNAGGCPERYQGSVSPPALRSSSCSTRTDPYADTPQVERRALLEKGQLLTSWLIYSKRECQPAKRPYQQVIRPCLRLLTTPKTYRIAPMTRSRAWLLKDHPEKRQQQALPLPPNPPRDQHHISGIQCQKSFAGRNAPFGRNA